MIELHPWVEVEVDGQAIVTPTGGQITLASLEVPYATAQVTIPWEVLGLEDLDPRDDVRVIISAGNTGRWVDDGGTVTAYGHGPYGHGPYGGN